MSLMRARPITAALENGCNNVGDQNVQSNAQMWQTYQPQIDVGFKLITSIINELGGPPNQEDLQQWIN